jgi:hypothetical protein
MYFWPFGVAILAAGITTLSLIALMMNRQKPNIVSKSPHHRSNEKTDLINAKESEVD